jgi:N-acetylglucosaminyl-diphospho-decaprenol L-rhamnosyltransferase
VGRTALGARGALLTRAGVSVVVVGYNALPWIDRCLESVAGYETVVVDHGSTDGTVALVREKFPAVRVVEQENRGLAAGWNRGIRETSGAYVLILNADAWALGDAVDRLAAFADSHPRAAVVGPRLRFPDGRLQPSVRGFPSPWRLATEYLFLRKLAPRSRALNAFYAGGFDY